MCHAFFIIIFSHPTSGKRLSVRYLRDVGDKGERTNAFLERKYNDDLEKQKADIEARQRLHFSILTSELKNEFYNEYVIGFRKLKEFLAKIDNKFCKAPYFFPFSEHIREIDYFSDKFHQHRASQLQTITKYNLILTRLGCEDCSRLIRDKK